MDDQTNGAYSRSPEKEDIVKLCKSLNEHGVKYVLIGGFAIILHGFTRGTRDVDLLIDPSKENIQKIKKALSYLPDNTISLIEDDEVQKYTVVRIGDEITIDLMAKACSVDYKEASKNVEFINVDGVKIPVANKKILIRMKDTVRPHDKTDVAYLKAVLEEENKK